ncbi:V-type ATPase, D subunit [human gut metagenome]|uniref:V-type ATPase, D subunit n=1 Tax=human gut metagenome TaxID=408170 RepID=K1SQC9_9ZZZZ
MNTKKSLALAKNGYELLDRKRNILIREMMTPIDHANAIQQKIDDAYAEAYTALQTANVTNGFCEDISNAIPYENGLKLDSRSVMGVEIPILTIEGQEDHHYLHYGLRTTNSAIDKVYTKFTEVKTLQLSLPRLRTAFIALPIQSRKLRREQTLSRTL